MSPRYGSTSLQRITKDTFGDALLHVGEQGWGWQDDDVRTLRDHHLKTHRIPAFDLAVWLFREDEWPDSVTPRRVKDRLVKRYKITEEEYEQLFDDQNSERPKNGTPRSQSQRGSYWS